MCLERKNLIGRCVIWPGTREPMKLLFHGSLILLVSRVIQAGSATPIETASIGAPAYQAT